MRSELRINGTYVDISDEVAMHLTFAINDIKNPDKRQGSYSKTVKLPGTDIINRLLGSIFEIGLNIQNTSTTNFNPDFNPNLKASCIVSCDSIEQFRGYMRLRSIERDKTNLQLLHYNCELFGDISTIFTQLADHKLTDLSLSEYNHTYNATNQIASWSATHTNGYYYPMIQYGNTDGINWDVKDFYPAVYLKTYIDKIFNYAGASYSSSFLTTSPFTKLVIPFGGTALRLTSSQVANRLFSANMSANYLMDPQTTYSPVIFDNETSDPSNQYNPATGYFTAATSGYYEFVISGTAYWNFITNGSLWNSVLEIAVTNTTTGAIILYTSAQLTTPGSWTAGQNTAPITFTATSPTSYVTAGDILKVSLRPQTYAQHTGTIKCVLTSGSVFKNTMSNPLIQEGDTLDMSAAIPEDVRMADLLSTVIKMFNLMVEPDRTQPNKYYIEPATTFYGSGSTRDWTSKLDTSKTFEIMPMGALDARRYRLTYKQDQDAYNQKYFNKWNDIYGVKKYDINNDFLKNENVFEAIFSPTPLVNNGADDRVYPYIYTLDNNGVAQQKRSNPRLLYNAGLKSTGYAWNYAAASGTTSWNSFPYAGHLDSVTAPTFDLSFGVPHEIYYNTNVYTDGNLWNRYHDRFINEITDKDSKLIEAWFYLTPLDILQLSFRDVIFVDGNYYRLQKVMDYNPSANSTTKCQLLKIKAHSDFLTGTYSFNPSASTNIGRDTAPNIVLGQTPMTRGQGAYNAGLQNIINDTNSGSVVAGYRNVVGYNSQRVFISASSGVTVYPNLTNVAVIGTNDITVTESNVTYINGIRSRGSSDIHSVSSSQTITGLGIWECTGVMTLTLSATYFRTGDVITVKRVAGGNVTISGGGINIDGSATYVLSSAMQSVDIYYNGTVYYTK